VAVVRQEPRAEGRELVFLRRGRIVNATTLVVGGADKIRRQRQQDFMATDRLSQKAYQGGLHGRVR
jgi:hypothetical protein